MRKRSQASEAGAALARRKWGKTTKAERSAHARLMNDARWEAKRDAEARAEAVEKEKANVGEFSTWGKA